MGHCILSKNCQMSEYCATRTRWRRRFVEDVGNLTPNPFPWWEGEPGWMNTAYGMMPPRWTNTLPLGPMRTQLMSVRLNSGVQSC